MRKFILHFVFPLVIVGGGIVVALYFKNKAAPAKQKPPENIAPSVEVLRVAPKQMTAKITATGTVTSAKQVVLMPEVSGRLVKLSDKIIPGNRLKKGDFIAKIDPREYALTVRQELSGVKQAELSLTEETGRKEIAEKELKLLGKDGVTAVSKLATRGPQLAVAKENTEAAKSGLKKAKLNLSRTVLRAPFNCIVLEKHVAVGRVVGTSTSVVTLMGTDELWVRASVPVERLFSLHIPGVNDTEGSKAEVVHHIGDKKVIREGRILRLEGRLDSQNRTAVLLVSIEKPFDVEGLPLLSGAFVNVTFEGRTVTEGFEIPSRALRENAFVWVLENKKLRKKQVDVAWRTRETVVVTQGLQSGDEVVLSLLSDASEGMVVNAMSSASSPATAPTSKDADGAGKDGADADKNTDNDRAESAGK